MDDRTRCPECGKTLESPGAECPACLLNLALETSSDGDAGTPHSKEEESRHRLSAGSRIGPYTIVRELGEGGMGVVYLAEQAEPIKRQVALKVIKHGMDTDQVVKRFEAERQALAVMDHVAIARVHEAGETETGRPYFAMEFIDGEPVTSFCDRHRLNTQSRLDLFTRICDGLQHAHQRGIIHRDIKPSNILVTEIDGTPQPKIIDFGVAKATERSLVEHSAVTAMGVLLGTPEYMSPEQANLSPHDVDTRTDVYSLGVVLYELLIGVPPLDTGALRKAAFDEVRRQIKEVRPSKPSTRFSQLGKQASDVARARRLDISSLQRRLSGDLDLIAMKALEKEPDRRYGSPAELRADIRRHLDDQPILARPASLLYHLRKAAARNRMVTALIALVLLVTVSLTAVNLAQLRETRSERDRAQREAETAEEVSGFLKELFRVADPRVARGREITVEDVLERGVLRIETELEDQPVVRVRLIVLLAEIYRGLGNYPEATRLFELVAEQGPAVLENDPELDTNRLTALAWIYRDTGQFEQGLDAARQAVERSETLDSLMTLGVLLRDSEAYDEARAMFDRTITLAQERLGEESTVVGWTMFHLAWLEHLQDRDEEAVALYERACAMLEVTLEEGDQGVATCLNDHSTALRGLGNYDLARGKTLLAVETLERVLPSDHPRLVEAIFNMGIQAHRDGEFEDAERHYRRVLEIRESALGPDHYQLGVVLNSLGDLLGNTNRVEEAEAVLRRSITIQEDARGRDDPGAIQTVLQLAHLHKNTGRFDNARTLFERAVDSRERTHGESHPWTAGALRQLAGVQVKLERYEDAAVLMRRAVAIVEGKFPPENSGRQRFTLALAECEARAGRLSRARDLVESVRSVPEREGVRDAIAANIDYLLAWIARSEGRHGESDALLTKALETRASFEERPSGRSLYLRAVLSAHAERREQALEELRSAIGAGFSAYDFDLQIDLTPLRGDPEFEEMLSRNEGG